MDSPSSAKAFRKVETEKRGENGDQVVVMISNEEGEEVGSSGMKKTNTNALKEVMDKQGKDSNFEMDNFKSTFEVSNLASSSPEITKFSPSPNRPPKVPKEIPKTLARSAFSKPKSRFVEPSGPVVSSLVPDSSHVEKGHVSMSPYKLSPNRKVSFPETPKEGLRNIPITPKTPLMPSPGDEEEDEEIYRIESVETKMEKSRKKWKVFVLIEWIALVCILGCMVASLTLNKLKHSMVWGLVIWKWSVLVLVIVCGRLMTKWFIHVLVFMIEKNFLLKNKVLYFIYGVRKSVHVFLWLALVLLAWVLLINRGVKRSRNAVNILNHVTKALGCMLIGALIWMVKNLLVKLLASNFQSSRFFDRIQESLFHQYVLLTLSGLPVMERAEMVGKSKSTGQLSFRTAKKGKKDIEQEVIDVNKLQGMRQEKVSAWTMKGLVNVVTTSGLSTISNTIAQIENEESEQKDSEITNEWEAKAAAYKIFKNVAKPGIKYIDEEDLLRFLSKKEVDNVLPLFEGAAEIGKIKKSALRNWVVKVYNDRKALAHSLNDTKTAVRQLNKIISAVVIVVIIIIWLLIMGLATIQVFVFISSQMLVVAFMFGNTAKTIFESIIFVFVMHPFDVGDRCVIEGVQMIVEEMNILTTVFLRYDNEKIYYPNSVLATKAISNFFRSPDMGDNVDFCVDVSTSVETIGALKARIKMYIETKPQHWRPNHSVVVKEIENLNKMKMALYITHTMNHQNYAEKNSRRTELVMEMKKIFEELSIKYHLLPQEVHLNYVGSAVQH
ncbi:Mechanosensitive ion channel protein [Thalictrum thalictroides]|uniref:Mechanosensitive ion channel protein n=1 Tax=Thalictrum thalictroides TaxID=46969 RepID=A0A7J6WEF9_THATH|nr:Mechanosensitive ion channel protein [Thalictrum thalictroides]